MVLPLLRDIKESIQEEYNTQLVVYKRLVEEFKEAETNRELIWGYKERQVNEGIGELRGISKAIEIIDDQIQVHEKVKCYMDTKGSEFE